MRSSVGKSKISDLIFDKYDQDRSGKWDRREMHFFCYDNGGFALTQAELSKVCYVVSDKHHARTCVFLFITMARQHFDPGSR